MWRLLTLCALSGLCLAVAQANGNVEGRSIETVRSKFTAFNLHDVAAIEKLYSQDAALNSPDYPDLVGNKPIAETYRKLFDAIPDAKDEIELLESAGNHIYVKFVMTGHWNGAQDKPISAHIMAVYTVRDGRIIDDATYYDRKTS
jgi:ketosteroid isomerase-like protein